jgi:Uma2 family endonuclease
MSQLLKSPPTEGWHQDINTSSIEFMSQLLKSPPTEGWHQDIELV